MASSWLTEDMIASPMSTYPEFREQRSSWYQNMVAGVVKITIEDGAFGLGFVGSGRADASRTVLRSQLNELLIGKEASAHQRIRDSLNRAQWHYGRGGITTSLLSGIDLALWDLKGKRFDQPVFALLGGPTRSSLPCYWTTLNPSNVPEDRPAGIKVAMAYGPADGLYGIRRNVELAERARERVGSDGLVAIDCYMAWDVAYTLKMERHLSDLEIAWIEEPVGPTDFESYHRITSSIGTAVAGGEHLHDLRDFSRLILEGGCEIVQPDLYRVGGITVALDVAALARAHNRRLICHGIGLPNYHFLMAMEPALSPICEFIDIESTSKSPWIFAGEPTPSDGQLTPPSDPGFGYRLRPELRPGGGVPSSV